MHLLCCCQCLLPSQKLLYRPHPCPMLMAENSVVSPSVFIQLSCSPGRWTGWHRAGHSAGHRFYWAAPHKDSRAALVRGDWDRHSPQMAMPAHHRVRAEEAELRVKAYNWVLVAMAKYKWEDLRLNAAPGWAWEAFCSSCLFPVVWSLLTVLASSLLPASLFISHFTYYRSPSEPPPLSPWNSSFPLTPHGRGLWRERHSAPLWCCAQLYLITG